MSILYLIILTVKLQNYRLALFLFFIAILPFTIGRNILEITLLKKGDIFGYSFLDLMYFIPFYLSDAVILLLFQNYLSRRFVKKEKAVKIQKNHFIAAVCLFLFILLTFISSINHEFGSLLIYSSIVLFKYLLIFLIPLLIDINKNKDKVFQVILASTLFQSALILFEYVKNGNIGVFIESTLPGVSYGTAVSETLDVLRGNGTFNEPNIAAIFLLINLCVILAYFFEQINSDIKKFNYFKLLIVFIVLSAMVFTGSRSILFLTGIVFVYFGFKYKLVVKNIFSILVSKFTFIIMLFVALLFIVPYLFNRIDTLKDVFNPNGALSYRNELDSHALQLANTSLFGIGVDMTPYYLAKNFKTVASEWVNFDPAPPHNLFIQIITEEGYLGLITFTLFLYFCAGKFFKNPNLVNSYAIASLAFLLSAQFHPAFTTHPEIFSFFILYLSIANVLE